MNQVNINTIVGDLSTKMEPHKKYGKEHYVFTSIKCCEAVIPVVMSQHFFDKYKGQRVELLAFPKKTRKNDKNLKKTTIVSFLEATFVNSTDSERDKRYVKIDGYVATEPCLKPTNDCSTSLQFELEYMVKFRNPVSVRVDCRIYGALARFMMDLEKGDYVRLYGYVAGSGKTLRVVPTRIKKGDVVDENLGQA